MKNIDKMDNLIMTLRYDICNHSCQSCIFKDLCVTVNQTRNDCVEGVTTYENGFKIIKNKFYNNSIIIENCSTKTCEECIFNEFCKTFREV